MEKGRIVKAISGFFYVKSDRGLVTCRGRGVFKINDVVPLVGDRVGYRLINDEENEGVLEKVYPRNNQLVRPPVANIDQVLAVFSIQKPSPNFVLLDRILLMAEKEELETIICFNKADLSETIALDPVWELINAYRIMGYCVYVISAKDGRGIEDLRNALMDKTTVLAGSSGVGKSTIINALFPGHGLKTGDISLKKHRGKHTTRHSEIYPAGENTWLMDSPGFSILSADDIDPICVRDYFRDISAYQSNCRFHSCVHLEEPDCAVKEAVADGKIHQNRYANYTGILSEINDKRRH